MRGIGLRHLRCFLEIARLGSVGGAAEALAVSQPAASKTLKELEERLGARLFDRSGRRIRLTEAGRLFQGHAGAALVELERGVLALAREETRPRTLVVGALPTVAGRIVPQAALAFSREVPGVTLRVTTGPNWLLLSQLRDGALDLVVGRLAKPEAMAGLVFEQLLSDPVVAVVRPEHPLRRGRGRILGDFPVILPPPGAIIRPTVEEFFLRIGQGVPRAAVETVSLALGRSLVRASDSVWFISRGVVEEELERGDLALLPLDALPPAGPVGLTRRAGVEAGPDLAALMAALRQAAGAGVDGPGGAG